MTTASIVRYYVRHHGIVNKDIVSLLPRFKNQKQQSACERNLSDSEVDSPNLDNFGHSSPLRSSDNFAYPLCSSPKRLSPESGFSSEEILHQPLISPGPSPKKSAETPKRRRPLRPFRPARLDFSGLTVPPSAFDTLSIVPPPSFDDPSSLIVPASFFATTGAPSVASDSSEQTAASSCSTPTSSSFFSESEGHSQPREHKQNTYWRHDRIESFSMPAGIIVFDFDKTLSISSTYGKNNKTMLGYHLDEAGIRANIRRLDELVPLLDSAKKAGFHLAVATKHPDMKHIQAYLDVLAKAVDPAHRFHDLFSVIVCAPETMPLKIDDSSHIKVKNKDGALQYIVNQLLFGKTADENRSLPIPLVLVDDERENEPSFSRLNEALQHRIDTRFYHAQCKEAMISPSHDYLVKLNILIAQPGPASEKTYGPGV